MHAFIKRVLQISTYFPPNMACATLYILSQVLHFKKCTKSILSKFIGTAKNEGEIDLNKEDESIDEVKLASKETENSIILSNVITDSSENVNDKKPKSEEIKIEIKTKVYDPFIRNPLHCGAHLSFYYELRALSMHFHPSVALFARTIMEGILICKIALKY
jgi:ribosome biogenesis protein MAK21